MPDSPPDGAFPEGVFSVLDTDMYKLTMQNAVFKHFPNVDVTYKYTNRTSNMFLNQKAFEWLRTQIAKLANVFVSDDEVSWLAHTCNFFTPEYLIFLKSFRFRPHEQVHITFEPRESGSQEGQVQIEVSGTWLDTILYEIPLLALVSESYFKFCDTDWDHQGQKEKAYEKGMRLMKAGCSFSEFGSRRRRDYRTHELVMQGLIEASKDAASKGYPGKLSGTSNVHFAKRFGVMPIGTVAHEWFMGIAAITNDYKNANELGLQYWVGTFGRGTLSIALTDTFGTPAFLEAFKKPASLDYSTKVVAPTASPSYAEVFTGTRQDSGDPAEFVKLVKKFYDGQGISERKTVVFSDSLDVEKCIEYKRITEDAGLTPSFGIGTFFTNDFINKTHGGKSVPLNIVIKLSSGGGRPAVKISDNLGKNTGDSQEVARVKRVLGYVERDWEGGDETTRWGR
ncbi:nicotinate phosphoribosyltransferase [Myriangium duriaei CBS 260.36]|uniref:Nicotinate phosphoribosyltransferase n=1 Tax=Myriangium duriaei CBS 260.36 TaxID=1168546 RepID=A0A9P4MLP2_9PEZI|nr:nicotinate phosphoribosyltransferase [Myriangium duriaei CBS 260.36]